MTREDINKQVNEIPETFRADYGLKLLEDLSDKSYELVEHEGETFCFYPDIPGVLIGSKLVKWEKGNPSLCDVDLDNPEHFEQILFRGSENQYDDIVGIMDRDTSGRLTMELVELDKVDTEYSEFFPIDGTVIYYNPLKFYGYRGIRFERKKQIAAALFLTKRYESAFMIPFKDEDPSEWGDYK